MSRWLAALKKHENGSGRDRQNRQNPARTGFVSSVSSESERSRNSLRGGPEVLSVLSVPHPGENEKSQPRTEAGIRGFVSSVSAPPKRIENSDAASVCDAWTDEDWQVAYDERAAILEYDEGLPRADAERLARMQVFGDRPIESVKLTIAREEASR